MSAQWTKTHESDVQVIWWCDLEVVRLDLDLSSKSIDLYAVAGWGEAETTLDADTAEAVGRELIRMAQALRAQT